MFQLGARLQEMLRHDTILCRIQADLSRLDCLIKANLPDSCNKQGDHAPLPARLGGWGRQHPAQTFVLRGSVLLLYTAHLAFVRGDTNLNSIGDRAEVRPPICRIASGSGGLADRKEEQSWEK